jgi:hypothetical protein
VLRVAFDEMGRASLDLDVGGQRGRYLPLQAYTVTPQEKAAFVGIYFNEDMRSETEIFSAEDGALRLRFGPAFHEEAEFDLEALAPDRFLARYDRPWAKHTYAVRSERSGGEALQLLVSSGLLKDTRFTRMG